jgi:hypothetical protein|tara:strand:- start:743 stop:979 length:237 start_codon:yes stop_codon:yes gene_type:complete
MDFFEITEDLKATPGEYIYHKPTNQIVLCGSFNRRNDQIRALATGRIFSDKIENFKKIKLTKEEQATRRVSRCKGCKK